MWATDMGGGGRNSEKVIYYRRKNGWITWGDTQASKQMTMIAKGNQPLPQFHHIMYSEDLWGPILRHPEGPALFPVEQVLTYRWYRKDMLPDLRPIVPQGRDLVRSGAQPKVSFPQLAGVKIVEFPCPEPCNRSFHSPLHLGGHLRVMHGYDRSEILKYGEAMGIDFSKVPGGKAIVEYDGATAVEAAQEVVDDAEYEVATVSAETPATPEVRAEIEAVEPACPEHPDFKPKTSNPGASLAAHRMHKHQKVAVPA